MRQPTFYLCHGGGPWPWMQGPIRQMLHKLEQGLRELPARLPARPSAIVVVLSHWETPAGSFTASAAPGMVYDFRGFPPETHRSRYASPGAPALASRWLFRMAQVERNEALAPGLHLIELSGTDLRGRRWTPGDKLQFKVDAGLQTRTYTPLSCDAAAGRMGFVAHALAAGPGSEWVRRARAGQPVAVLGPRRSLDLATPGARRGALLGDETAIGLAAAWRPSRAVIEADRAGAHGAIPVARAAPTRRGPQPQLHQGVLGRRQGRTRLTQRTGLAPATELLSGRADDARRVTPPHRGILVSHIANPRLSLLALATLASLAHLPARAHGGGGEPAVEGTQWGLGLAVMSERKPYRGVENKTRVLPAITFENRWVRLFGPGLELKLGQSGPVKFGLTADLSEDGYKSGDSAFLAGMAERKSGLWLGARVQAATDWAIFSAQWSGDASGHSEGQKFRLTVERRFALGDIGISPRLSALWSDGKTNQYYYGVRAAEATVQRPAYSPGAGVDTEVGLRLDYRIAPKQVLFADLGLRSLGSEVRNSPLVDRSSVPEVRLGYLYRF